MLNNKFYISASVAIFYFIIKIIEQRLILKEVKPIKVVTRDTFIVYISSLIALFVLEQLSPLSDISNVPNVFVNEPDF